MDFLHGTGKIFFSGAGFCADGYQIMTVLPYDLKKG
jgi:hypothetical protein